MTYANTSETPSPGTRTVAFQVNDGSANSAAVTRNVNVTAVNDAPVLGAVGVGGVEDTTVAFTLANFTGSYSDVEGGTLASIKVVGLPATGTLKLSGVNVNVNDVILAANLGNLSYVPGAIENGP